jgi:hypothetical protein
MGDGIHINHVAERFSSHTLSHSRPVRYSASRDSNAVREKLMAALVEIVAEGGDPRLAKTLALP